MNTLSRRLGPIVAIAALAGLTSLYRGALETRFLNDDYWFLEDARGRDLAQSLISPGPLGNYYRPISRQIYFEALAPIAGGHPAVFHIANFGLLLASLALLADLLAVFLPAPGILAGLLYFALIPFQRVNLTWVSCSQDLMALTLCLTSFALFRRGRLAFSALAYLGAVFSKESALPLPLVLVAWTRWWERPAAPWARLVPRLAPFALVVVAWALVVAWMRARHPSIAATIRPDFEHFAAGVVHGVQSLLGLDHPGGWVRSLAAARPNLVALAGLSAPALWLAARAPLARIQVASPDSTKGTAETGSAPIFGAAWIASFGLITGPAADTWSSYYYTLTAVGGALIVGWLARRVSAIGWLALTLGLLWWHAAGVKPAAFAVVDRPWGWTSHLTSAYFERAAALTDTLSRQLRALVPRPEPRTRFYFSTLPSYAGFQMGNGALVRALYRDSTLQSFFYSQYSESTAADHPARFLYWDGRALAPLYEARTPDPLFQVGTDLLTFDRIEGARHAFRRGIREQEDPREHLYWLGWAELWLGRRDAAETAWTWWGAREDSLRWITHMRLANHRLLEMRDTLAARRQLAEAIRWGIGRPEGHAVLGELLRGSHPKYGLLELRIACYLKPQDWRARRELLAGLVEMRLDHLAREELETLDRHYIGSASDSVIARARSTLAGRSSEHQDVAEF